MSDIPEGKRDSGTMPYRRIVDDIRSMIQSGELGPGDKLPSQPELVRQYRVASATVGRAISTLVNEGLVTTRVGSGAYVRSFERILRSSPRRLATSQWGAGHAVQDADTATRPRSVGVEVEELPAPQSISEAMGLAPDAMVVRRQRAFVVDGDRTVQLATSWYPGEIAVGTAIAQLDTGPGGAPARLADAGHAPKRHRERVRSRMPSADEMEALGLAGGTSVFQIQRLSYDAADRCVELTDMILDGSAYELEYIFES